LQSITASKRRFISFLGTFLFFTYGHVTTSSLSFKKKEDPQKGNFQEGNKILKHLLFFQHQPHKVSFHGLSGHSSRRGNHKSEEGNKSEK